MRRPQRSSALVILVCAVLAALVGLGALQAAARWTATKPRINAAHVFEGEINRKGRPVGFHSRPGGRDPRGARVSQVVSRPNRQGVYEARVEIRDPESGRWLGKRSTMFPDSLSREEVVRAILNAYRQRTTGKAERFRGPSGRGFTIEGYLLRGDINTAYPIYR
ncbi:MAG TPA: EndoU domain-containing protein [Thermoanaerobaculia bacterium]|nr:EndoU domain-containing protein [Thermoanaerobaculia bacterium]